MNTLVSNPDPVAAYAAYEGELAAVLDAVLAGDLGTDLTSVERRAVESLGALAWLLVAHRVNGRGRCRVCRSSRGRLLWWRRPVCTVYRAVSANLHVSGRCVPSAVAAGAAGAGGRS